MRALPDEVSTCPSCGADVLALGAGVAPGGSTTVEKPPGEGAVVLFWLGSVLLILFSLLVALPVQLRETRRLYPFGGPEAEGFLAGGLLAPMLLCGVGVAIYYWIRRRRPVRRERKFFVFATWTAGMTVISLAGAHQTTPAGDPKKVVGSIMKEAMGGPPSGVADSEWTSAMRDFFKEVKAYNDNYVRDMSAAAGDELAELYQASSFRNQTEMSRMLSILEDVKRVDEHYSSVEPLIEKTRARVTEMNISESAKADFLTGIEKSWRQTSGPRAEVFLKEFVWLDASLDLYNFALQNYQSIAVSDGEILITDETIRADFNKRFERATAKHREVLRAQEAFDKLRKENLSKYGVAPSDLGALPPSSSPEK